MKIKNLKINKKEMSKLATCVLVASLTTTTLTGCGKHNILEDTILENTILENTCVVTFSDGSKDIVTTVDNCDNSEYYHYYSVISGEYFGDEQCVKDILNSNVVHHYPISSEETITSYLTADELSKAAKGELSTDDIAAIISRIIAPIAEETNAKTK